MPVSMVLPVDMARLVWVVENSLGRFRQPFFLSVREGFELAVFWLEKSSEKIDTEPWLEPESVPDFWLE